MNETVGIIGQVYENRRTGAVGKLTGRNEKYKTLDFETEDGKSFVLSYSTFKSNMRKKPGAEVLTPESEVKRAEIKAQAAEVAKLLYKQNENPEEEISSLYQDLVRTVIAYMQSFDNSDMTTITIQKHNGIALRFKQHRLIEFYAVRRTHTIKICMAEDDYASTTWSKDPVDVSFHELWRTLTMKVIVNHKDFDKALEDLRPVLINAMSQTAMKKKKKEKQNGKI